MKRAAVGMFVAGLVFVTILLARPAGALPQTEREVFYLNEEGEIVGSYFRGCDGSRFTEGTTTTNTMTLTFPCSNPPAQSLECRWHGAYGSCAQNLFWQACVPHFGEELCTMS